MRRRRRRRRRREIERETQRNRGREGLSRVPGSGREGGRERTREMRGHAGECVNE
jgi:hypothetical protein